MSKHETPMVDAYWRTIGGTLIPEFLVVPASKTCGPRRVDGLIMPSRETRKIKVSEVRGLSFEGEDVIVVQAKAQCLNLGLLGQAVFSAQLIRRFNPRSVRSIALVLRDHPMFRSLLGSYPEVEVMVMNLGTRCLADNHDRDRQMVHAYWSQVGGTLVERFPLIARSSTVGSYRAHAIVLPHGNNQIATPIEVSLEGKDVIVVQARARRLGMLSMGKALFSAELVKQYKPRSVRSVIVCTKDDSVLRPLLAPLQHIDVVVLPEFEKARGTGSLRKRYEGTHEAINWEV